MPGFKLTDQSQIDAATRLRDFMSESAESSRLMTRKVPEGYGFTVGPQDEYCVKMGTVAFLVAGPTYRDPNRLCVTLEEKRVQLKFVFNGDAISVVVRELGASGRKGAHSRKEISYVGYDG